THTTRIARASGRICATMIGTKKIPPPMTLDTTMAAASSGPRRRSRDGETFRVTRAVERSWGAELTRARIGPSDRPRGRAGLGGQLDGGVDKRRVLEHVDPRLGSRVPHLRLDDLDLADRARCQ